MVTITKEQKKVLKYVAAGTTTLVLFWVFVYLPNRNQMQQIQLNLAGTEKQLNSIKNIDEIKNTASKGYTYTESIENLKNELVACSKSIPTAEEDSLQYLSASAQKLNLEILSIRPDAKELLLDENKNKVKIAGLDCCRLSVKLSLKGSYMNIAKYIETLTKNAPSLLSVENLKITGLTMTDSLMVDMDLTIYLKG